MTTPFPIPEEVYLTKPLANPSAERLRPALLHLVSVSSDPSAQARNLIQLALGTPLAALFPRLRFPAGYLTTVTDRTTLATATRLLYFLLPSVIPAIHELAKLRVDLGVKTLLEQYARSPDPAKQLSAACATVLLHTHCVASGTLETEAPQGVFTETDAEDDQVTTGE